MASSNIIRGVDHIGLTVPNIEEAEAFLFDGLGAEYLYETLNRRMPPFESINPARAEPYFGAILKYEDVNAFWSKWEDVNNLVRMRTEPQRTEGYL